MKILLLAWNRLGRRWKGNWNHEFFRRELARQHEVIFWGIGYEGHDATLNVSDVLKRNPEVDVILTHFEHREKALAPGLEDIKDILKVHIMGGDYYREREFKYYDPHLRKMEFDLIFSPLTSILRNLKGNGIEAKHHLLLWAVNTDKYYKQNIEKTVDVMCSAHSGANHPNRYKLKRIIYKMKDINSFLDGIYFDEYIEKINQSKIFATCNIQNAALNGRYSEVLACGTFLLATRPEDLERGGYKDGEHLVIYKNDFSDLEDKIRYFLKHDKEREEIAANGMKHVRKNHSHETRVKEFAKIVEGELHGEN